MDGVKPNIPGSVQPPKTPEQNGTQPPNQTEPDSGAPLLARIAVCGVVLTISYLAARAISSIATTLVSITCYTVIGGAGVITSFIIISKDKDLTHTHTFVTNQIEKVTTYVSSWPLFKGLSGN